MHAVTCNVTRTTFLSPGQLFTLPEIPKLAFDAKNSSKQHIKCRYYFTESTLRPQKAHCTVITKRGRLLLNMKTVAVYHPNQNTMCGRNTAIRC